MYYWMSKLLSCLSLSKSGPSIWRAAALSMCRRTKELAVSRKLAKLDDFAAAGPLVGGGADYCGCSSTNKISKNRKVTPVG